MSKNSQSSNTLATSPGKKEEAKENKKIKALLVDDNYEFFQVLQLTTREYFDLEYAPDGFSAFKMAKRFSFDVIICDINMPFMNGLMVINEFKKKNLSVPFLFITGSVDDQICREALRAGAYNILEKPFETKELVEKVKLAIKLHQKEEIQTIDEQDRAYIYNTLKSYYYDVEKIMQAILQYNIPVSNVNAELEKKIETGKCIFDDVQSLKYYKSSA